MIDDLRSKYLEFFKQRAHLIYPSAPLKSDDPTLLFTSAGMVQFKPYFLGATPKFAGVDGVWHRVTTAQKCLRVNDIENVGRTLRHHSFFEMMGNFSFGDYFKQEASQWAWEFLTSPDWLGLDPKRLYVTVYTEDDEAYKVWRDIVGVPEERISRWGEDENFWPANAVTEGPNGPCGPCSEIFYDRGPSFGSPDESGPNTGTGDRFVEIWNLVFTQYDRKDGGVLEPLPQQNIDTGLGFERLVAVMTDAEDAYATGLFQPTIRRVAELSGRPYAGMESISHRVIADHVRAVTFCVADGIMPANDGAGYIVKMLLRRAARHAWLLGIRESVLGDLVDQVIEAMGSHYPELKAGRDRIRGVIDTEERHFLSTLESGITRFRQLLDSLEGSVVPGATAFDLWQTYGFPLDLTREMAAERGIEVDSAGFEAARQKAREASRGSKESAALFTAQSDVLGQLAAAHGETDFTGYAATDGEARIVALIRDDGQVEALSEGDRGTVLLDRTPFYPEGGGQVGDPGRIDWQGGSALVSTTTRSAQGLFLHAVRIVRGRLATGDAVTARVDPARSETEKHHTATHLLHAALREVLGTHVGQAGSLVAADRLRFDFSHPRALSREDLGAIELLVNRKIQLDAAVTATTVSLSEARDAGAMMLFGEKYGEQVRMVSIGNAGSLSIELCGGTHVDRTGRIGCFMITEESAVSAGVRRIEARAGLAAVKAVQEQRQRLQSAASVLGTSEGTLTERLERVLSDLKAAQREQRSLMERLAAAQTAGADDAASEQEAAGLRFGTADLKGLDASALRNAADTMLDRRKLDVSIMASGPLLVVKVSPGARERGAHAGNLVKELAQLTGGRGGGRPDMAQAGIGDRGLLEKAFEAVPELLRAQVAGS